MEEDQEPKYHEGLRQSKQSVVAVGGWGGIVLVTVVPGVNLTPPDRGTVVQHQGVIGPVLSLFAQAEGDLLGFVVVEEVKQTEERSEVRDYGEDSGRGGKESDDDKEDCRGEAKVSFLDFINVHV